MTTPDHLRREIARLASRRLAEMDRQWEQVCGLRAEGGGAGPVRCWVLIWAGEVEIARRADLGRRRRAAEELARTLDRDDPRWRAAMSELLAVVNEARGSAAGP